MDVITILQPENHIGRPLLPVSHRRGIRSALTASRPALSSLREMPVTASFSLLLLLLVTLLIAVTPVFQQRYGFYRLESLSLPTDTHAESALRLFITPESDASLLSDATENVLPLVIQSISYSSYTVRSGDTISAILGRSGLHNISTIFSANNIDNARRIKAGQVLKIPSMDGIFYTVSRGDTLARIAGLYSIPVNAILDSNDLSKSTLVSGQILFIPGASLSSKELRHALGEFFVIPIKGRLTSRFGYRKDPFTGVRTFHTGIDLAAPIGTPIKATQDGKIATTGFSTVYGNYVIISHDDGYQSLYGHMSFIGVKRGERVTQGSTIGKVGNTGYSTGSHVHFSVYKNGKMLDPYSVL